MNDDERFLKDWLDDDVPDPDGARQDADQIMARLPETKQRTRWWPLLPARRTQPRSSSDGQPPTINGRTRTMFSPVKAITAGALVFAMGGALLVTQPFSQQSAVPGAEAEAIAPTWVTGTVEFRGTCSEPDTTVDIVVMEFRNYECGPQTWTASDPRISGEAAVAWNEDVYRTDEGAVSVNMTVVHMSNDDGGWVCSSSNLFKGSGLFPEGVTGMTAMCVGEAGYEGLSALLVFDGPAGPQSMQGIIFSGDFPPLPEPPAVE
jgi:hypothetical protein